MKLTAPLRQEDAKRIRQFLRLLPRWVMECHDYDRTAAALDAAIAGKKPAEPTPAERLAELERRGQRVLPETTTVPDELGGETTAVLRDHCQSYEGVCCHDE